MKTNSQTWNRVAAAAKLLLLVAFIVVLSPLIARAQTIEELWISDSNNIYNTNSGNVGIGGNPPIYRLDVWADKRGVARFGNTNGNSEVMITRLPVSMPTLPCYTGKTVNGC